MTKDEIITLEGRELDAVVAEKLYRCRVCGGTEYRIWGKKQKRRVCIVCHKRNQQASYQRHKDKIAKQRAVRKPWEREKFKKYRAKHQLMHRYGMTLKEYDGMEENQGGACAICRGPANGKSDRLCVDHDHETGAIRGLLCNKCNVGLANFCDSPATLRAAADYLERAALLAMMEVEE